MRTVRWGSRFAQGNKLRMAQQTTRLGVFDFGFGFGAEPGVVGHFVGSEVVLEGLEPPSVPLRHRGAMLLSHGAG